MQNCANCNEVLDPSNQELFCDAGCKAAARTVRWIRSRVADGNFTLGARAPQSWRAPAARADQDRRGGRAFSASGPATATDPAVRLPAVAAPGEPSEVGLARLHLKALLLELFHGEVPDFPPRTPPTIPTCTSAMDHARTLPTPMAKTDWQPTLATLCALCGDAGRVGDGFRRWDSRNAVVNFSPSRAAARARLPERSTGSWAWFSQTPAVRGTPRVPPVRGACLPGAG